METKLSQANALVIELQRLGVFLHRQGDRLTKDFGLKQQQFVVLNAIIHRGQARQKDLVSRLLYEKSNVSKIVKKLEKLELITLSVPSSDRRGTIVRPTQKGQELHRQCLSRLDTWSEQWTSTLSPEDITEGLKFIKKLLEIPQK